MLILSSAVICGGRVKKHNPRAKGNMTCKKQITKRKLSTPPPPPTPTPQTPQGWRLAFAREVQTPSACIILLHTWCRSWTSQDLNSLRLNLDVCVHVFIWRCDWEGQVSNSPQCDRKRGWEMSKTLSIKLGINCVWRDVLWWDGVWLVVWVWNWKLLARN